MAFTALFFASAGSGVAAATAQILRNSAAAASRPPSLPAARGTLTMADGALHPYCVASDAAAVAVAVANSRI